MKIETKIWCTNPEDIDYPPAFAAYEFNMTDQGWVKVAEVEFTYEGYLPTREELLPKAVESLRQKQAEMVERHQKEFKALQARLANLLSLTNEAGGGK